MTTTQTDALMALADRYAFHIPGSQHSDEARAALLAALRAREGHIEALKRARDTAMNQSAKSHIPECGHFAVIAQDLDWAIGNVDSINTSKERVENDRANVQVQAREGAAIANSAILARGRFHAFKGEDGEPDDWEWFEEGTNCEHGCIDAVIVRADAISAPQPAQPVALPLTPEELDLCRQWFNSVQDVNGGYLTTLDYVLAEKLYRQLNMRVPNSISEITKSGIGGAL